MTRWEHSVAPLALLRGQVLARKGETGPARAAFLRAKQPLQGKLNNPTTATDALSYVGLVHAGLGDKQAALKAAHNAVDKLPTSRDAIVGGFQSSNAWRGSRRRSAKPLQPSSICGNSWTHWRARPFPSPPCGSIQCGTRCARMPGSRHCFRVPKRHPDSGRLHPRGFGVGKSTFSSLLSGFARCRQHTLGRFRPRLQRTFAQQSNRQLTAVPRLA